jgi:hypothetical protein
MNDQTHRFFLFSIEENYNALLNRGNEARDLPSETTQRWIANWEDLFLDPETSTSRLYCIKREIILETDIFEMDGIEEIDLETYLARLRWEPPVEDDLEMIDELELVE